MDTISRENNSFLPLAGVIAGALALLLAIVALFKLSAAGKEITALKEDINSRIMSMESQVSSAAQTASEAKNGINSLQRGTQDGFNAVADQLAAVRVEITKVQEAMTKPKAAAAAGGAAKGPVVAGPDEYVVKSGDTGMKIAKANGVSIADLQAVNPSVNWTKLKPNDKVKLPKK
jgi:LysM repeat protein